MIDFASARTKMVDSQLRTEDVTDHDVLRVMGEVPREMFVPARLRPLAYLDDDLPLTEAAAGAPARTLIRAAPLARMIQAAGVGREDIVLDVGCATGYSSAVLARLAGSVVALESDSRLAAEATETLMKLGIDNVAVVGGPLAAGYPSEGPYDLIFVGGSVEAVPAELLGQLKQGGRLVAVVGTGRAAVATLFTHSEGDTGSRPLFNAYLPPLPGFARPKAFVF
ncbi:MAG TPA: protein-L-isoaspartate O-methyltransferase [Bauldia sp.]|nr:protein-L-isoaspartate O-methyltransferase [Bauldia sp.]